jgi:hypothetical protein
MPPVWFRRRLPTHLLTTSTSCIRHGMCLRCNELSRRPSRPEPLSGEPVIAPAGHRTKHISHHCLPSIGSPYEGRLAGLTEPGHHTTAVSISSHPC